MNYIAMPGLKFREEIKMYEFIDHDLPDNIINTIATHFKITVSDLKKKNRIRKITMARFYAYYFIRRDTILTLDETAKLFGQTNHATVINGLKQLEKLRSVYPDIDREITIISNKL